MLDTLKRQIQVGDTVLTFKPGFRILNTLATVISINKKATTVVVEIEYYMPMYEQWHTTRTRPFVTRTTTPLCTMRVRRKSHQIIAVDAQIADNKKEFPENFL